MRAGFVSSGGGATVYTRLRSRFPQIIAALPGVGAAMARNNAHRIAEEARERVPVESGDLRDAIHVEQVGPKTFAVVAGDEDVFYGAMVEFGTHDTAARPFLTPAAESVMGGLTGKGLASNLEDEL